MTRKYKSNLRKKIYATIVDYTLFFICLFAYLIFFGVEDGNGGYQVSNFATLPVFIYWIIYFVIIESMYGATLGHQCFNLKVVTLQGENIGLTQALKRRFLDPIDLIGFGLIAFIIVRSSEKHQRVGDIFAKTIVIDNDDQEQNMGPLKAF